MRYIQPQITGTFNAVSTIRGIKDGIHFESGTDQLSMVAAYPADE
ncbi:MAG: hypothetical protein ABR905_17260 [Terracidiphilus sp.]